MRGGRDGRRRTRGPLAALGAVVAATTVLALAPAVPAAASVPAPPTPVAAPVPATAAVPATPPVAATTASAARLGATSPAPTPSGRGVAFYTVQRTADSLAVVSRTAADASDALRTVGDVARTGTLVTAGLDTRVSTLGSPDPLRGQQWALDRVRYEATWPRTSGAGVTVAVVDTGVRGDHEDLTGSVLPGADLVGGGDGRTDPNGHGTHVAGIIAAHVGNGRGIEGAAPSVRILPVRVLAADGSGYSSDVARGIIYAADHGARVVNLSLGGPTPSSAMQAAIQYAESKGAVVVAAAGNSGSSSPIYPAAFSDVLGVGAVDSGLHRASFSNYGTDVSVVAPGVGIVSTWSSSPAAYATASGTSMATPYVSAAAALLVASHPQLSAAQADAVLESTADDLGPAGVDAQYGHGLVDPYRAVSSLDAVPAQWTGSRSKGGYWVVSADGRVRPYGDARSYGDLGGTPLAAPIVASAPTPSGKGYWLAGADGAVFAFGDAHYYGSMWGRHLAAPIVGMAATPDGHGYLLLGADGGIFTFGDAHFYGSTGAMRLNAPVLDMTMSPDGHGYWLVAADGGIFTFGDARFRGSTGAMRLASPVASMSAAHDGRGYWLVAADGGIFSFGTRFLGSLPGLHLAGIAPGVRIRALPDGSGYYILARDGAVFSFGTAAFHGASAPLPAATPAVDLMLRP